jgi:hypothetical protein
MEKDQDDLIDRAFNLMGILDNENEVAKVLMDSGETAEDVFLAVKAAKILNDDEVAAL